MNCAALLRQMPLKPGKQRTTSVSSWCCFLPSLSLFTLWASLIVYTNDIERYLWAVCKSKVHFQGLNFTQLWNIFRWYFFLLFFFYIPKEENSALIFIIVIWQLVVLIFIPNSSKLKALIHKYSTCPYCFCILSTFNVDISLKMTR